MLKREDFNGKPYQELASAIEAELVMYTEQVSKFETMEQCLEEEKILMTALDEVKVNLNNTKYELPDHVEYDGKRYSKKDISTKIAYFLNKIEVKWEHTIGMYELVSLWRSEEKKHIFYAEYDSTLRSLNLVTFKGYQEWSDIIVVNEYLSKCHNDYSLDTGILVYLHEMHNILMNKMNELDPNADIPEKLN